MSIPVIYLLDALINETAVTVYNAGRKGSPDGELNDISGIAVTTGEPGELLVYFEGSTDAADCAYFFSFFLCLNLIVRTDIVIHNIHCCMHPRSIFLFCVLV